MSVDYTTSRPGRAEMPCECSHAKWSHNGGAFACWECTCKRYTPDIGQAAKGGNRARRDSEPAPAPAVDGESTSARLRRAERERDEAAGKAERLHAQLVNALECFDQLQSRAGLKYQAYEVELAVVKAELEQLRAERGAP